MKHRNPLVVALLALITLGIYGVYWLYKTRLEILQRSGAPAGSIPRVLYLFAPLLVIVGVLIIDTIIAYATREGSLAVGFITLFVVGFALLALIAIPFWWYYKYNMAVAATARGIDGVSFYLIWFVCMLLGLYIIWMALVQNDLNKLTAKPTIPDTPYPPHHPPVAQPPARPAV